MNRLCIAFGLTLLVAEPAWGDEASSQCSGSDYVPPTASNAHTTGDYPPLSLALREQGITTLEYHIDETGTPTDVKVSVSSGSLRLDAAAVDAVTQNWRYTPPTKAGKPVHCPWRTRVIWDLKQTNTQKLDLRFWRDLCIVIEATTEMYPDGALERGETGDNIIVLRLSPQTEPTTVRIKESGFADLDAAAEELVRRQAAKAQCRFDEKSANCQILFVVAWRQAAPQPDAGKAPAPGP